MPATLTLAPAVADLVKPLVWHQHDALGDAAILCLFSDAAPPAEVSVDAVVKAKLASPEVRAVSTIAGGLAKPVDLLLIVNAAAWSELGPTARVAYLDHGLSHFEVRIGDDRHVTYKLRNHDVGEFSAVAARHGQALPGLSGLLGALAEAGREVQLPDGRSVRLYESDEDEEEVA
jgi:hypothetical protein